MSDGFVATILAEPETCQGGLASGELRRIGGTIRRAQAPYKGSIAGFMREVSSNESTLSKGLAQNLQLTEVAAAASVFNLGVSVIGFAIMAHKLDRLQRDLNHVARTLDRNHAAVMGELGDTRRRLVELELLARFQGGLLREAVHEIRTLQRDALDGYVARMVTAWSQLQRLGNQDSRVLNAARTTYEETRVWLELGLQRRLPSAERPDLWFDVLTRYRYWCIAAQGEIGCQRAQGDALGAVASAEHGAQCSRRWAEAWCEAIVPATEYSGVHRFAHSAFHNLPSETIERLRRMQAGGKLVDGRSTLGADYTGAIALARDLPARDSSWIETQVAGVRVLDFVEEVTERLEGLHEEMHYVERHRLTYQRWEALSPPAEQQLAYIPIEARA